MPQIQIFIGNIAHTAGREDVRQLLRDLGIIYRDVIFTVDGPARYAHANLPDWADPEVAIRLLNGRGFQGRELWAGRSEHLERRRDPNRPAKLAIDRGASQSITPHGGSRGMMQRPTNTPVSTSEELPRRPDSASNPPSNQSPFVLRPANASSLANGNHGHHQPSPFSAQSTSQPSTFEANAPFGSRPATDLGPHFGLQHNRVPNRPLNPAVQAFAPRRQSPSTSPAPEPSRTPAPITGLPYVDRLGDPQYNRRATPAWWEPDPERGEHEYDDPAHGYVGTGSGPGGWAHSGGARRPSGAEW